MIARLARAAVCLAVAAGLAGPAWAQEAARPKSLRIALNGYENNITPFTMSFGATPNTHDLMMLVYDSLFWSQVKEDPEPWLAERAESSPDFKVWTITLHDGVTWHDGKPLTAEDVKFSFEYYLKNGGASGRYAHHVADQPSLETAEVVDPRTIRLSFKAPNPTFKIMPGADLPIIPKHVWEGVTEPSKAASLLPVGSGPYKVVEMKADELYRLEANTTYFKGRPTVDEIVLPIVKDQTAAFTALRTGEVGFVTRNLPSELAEQFTNAAGIEVAEGTKFESVQLYFNARKAPLTDAKLRKAISLAVDSQALVDTVLLGRGRPGVDSFIHPDSPWALPGAEHDYDVARAQQLLDEAGYRAKDSDGVRKAPNGSRLEFAVLVSSFEPQQIRAVQLLAQQVAPIGVKIVPEVLDPATLRQRRNPPAPGQAPGYDAYITTLEAHAHVDPDALYYFFHSPGPKGFGASITGYSNPRLDTLVEQATVLSVQDRKALLHEAQEILAEEAPVVVLWYPNGEYAYRPDAYNGWVSDFGHGLFTKRSFLPEYAGQLARSEGGQIAGGSNEDDGGSAGWLIPAVAAAVAVALGAGVVSRRRRHAGVDDEA